MKRRAIISLLAVSLWLVPLSGWVQGRESASSLGDLARLEARVENVSEKALPATVALVSEQTGSSGSGVIVSEDGLVLTAAHVVQGADEMQVVFPDGKQVRGEVLGANYSRDIAMVRIAEAGKWTFVDMGKSKPLKAGDWVVALGHSAGFDPNRTPPVRFGRVISEGPGNFLTTDCTLIGGDSGGPLFDLDGRLVGVHSSIGQSLTNNNHAGIDGFREDWERMLAGETWGELTMNPFANPEMPVLGIGMGMMRGVKGVIVESVAPGSPAAAAGVRPGDVIQHMDGSEIQNGGELLQVLAKRQPGDEVKLGLARERRALDVNVTLKRRNEIFEQRQIGGLLAMQAAAAADEEVPLLRPEERSVIVEQEDEFNRALEAALAEGAKSTVKVWAGRRRVANGTVVGDGTRILTKWSELPQRAKLVVEGAGGVVRYVTVAGVYENEDLAVLAVEGEPLTPVRWSYEKPKLGTFLAASQPDGQPAAFGVVSVLERNLRDTEQAYLGVIGDFKFKGPGVRVQEVSPGSGAANAGLKAGDVILKVGERSISGLLELKNALAGADPGSSVALEVQKSDQVKIMEAVLGNRPELPSVSSDRLSAMEKMGGPTNRVNGSFSNAIQTDMRPHPAMVGGPVVDLRGEVVGIALERTGRTRSYVMPAAAVEDLLKQEPVDPALARAKPKEVASARPRMVRAPHGGGMGNMRRHLEEMERLMEFMHEEMDGLEQGR